MQALDPVARRQRIGSGGLAFDRHGSSSAVLAWSNAVVPANLVCDSANSMRKIPTNSPAARRKAELPLDLDGPHVTPDASSQHRLYQALCHAITGGIAKPGEPLPPQRTLAKQTGFRRNAVTSAYERLIADGFAVATVGSGTFVAARIPARASDARKTRIAIEAPQQGALALGCTHIDERALQRFRSFAGRRMRAFGDEHLQYGDPRGSRELRAAIADHLLSARGLRCDPDQIMLASGTQHCLRIVLGAILKPGDHIWCEDPGYPAARRAIGHYGLRPVSVPVDASGMIVAKGRTPRAVGGRGLRDAVAPVSARRADVDAAAAGTARLGKGGRRLRDRGRLRQRVSIRRCAIAVARRHRSPLARHLHGHVCQDAVSRIAHRLLRAARAAGRAGDDGPRRARPLSRHAARRRGGGHAQFRRVRGKPAQGARDLSRSARRPGFDLVGGIGRASHRCRCPRRACIWSRGSIHRPIRWWPPRQRRRPASRAGCWRKPIFVRGRCRDLSSALPATRSRNWLHRPKDWRRHRWLLCGQAVERTAEPASEG